MNKDFEELPWFDVAFTDFFLLLHILVFTFLYIIIFILYIKNIHRKKIIFKKFHIFLFIITFIANIINDALSIMIFINHDYILLKPISCFIIGLLTMYIVIITVMILSNVSDSKIMIERIKELDYMHLNDEQITDILNFKYSTFIEELNEIFKGKYDKNIEEIKYLSTHDYLGNVISELDYDRKDLKKYFEIHNITKEINKIFENDKENYYKREEYNRLNNDDYYECVTVDIAVETIGDTHKFKIINEYIIE